MTTLEEAIAEAIDSRKDDVYTSFGAVVKRFDAAAGTVDVQPGTKRPIKREDDSYTSEALPILYGVPVVFPCGNGARMTWELAPGDRVLVCVSWLNDRNFVATGREGAEPGDVGTHNLSSCYAIAGVATSIPAPGPVTIVADPVRLGSETASEDLALASFVEAVVTAISTATAGGDPLVWTAPTTPSRAARVKVDPA